MKIVIFQFAKGEFTRGYTPVVDLWHWIYHKKSHRFQSETHGFLGEKCWPVKPWSLRGITGPLMDPLAKHHRCRAPCSTKKKWLSFCGQRCVSTLVKKSMDCFQRNLLLKPWFSSIFHGFLQFFHASYQKVEDFPWRQIPIIQFWDTIRRMQNPSENSHLQ